MKVAPGDFVLDAKSIEDMVHTYSYGLPRAMVNLLCEAWQVAKDSRGRNAAVTPVDITRAYKNLGVQRTNVELLWKFGISGEKQRPDLRSPFAQPDAEGFSDAPRVAALDFERRVMEKHLEESQTPMERAASKSISNAIRAASIEQASSKEIRSGARKTKTKADLLDALREFGLGNI